MTERHPAWGRGGVRAVYDQYGRLVFSVALSALGSRADAEDVTQQVFVRAWRSRETYDADKGTLRTWLLTITRRVVADRLGALARQRAADLAAVRNGHAGRAGDLAEDTVQRLAVAARLHELTDQQRLVVRMAFFEDLTHAQIAERTGLPLGTVKSHLRRALLVLRNRWEADDAAP
ncbi:RNA polymerase sigma factor [Actinophytocola sp.]|uniref:RNA polymerase sigma factor n=1 Tax=Actinophytocola sp. TaxID=1872138 RepID=UPI002D7E48AB|nr:sigma-70 family RNA polymerase sigma factor [Actinophytocola sp.]HET9139160.1 sigma-70 family RNA polymerase sigma factor [Actinophytocola sp.]